MINNLFGGSPAGLILQALGNHKTSMDELNEIEKKVNDLRKLK
jgi:hypothetical protein